ncbi:MAG: IS66 family insertion sequence element accessory protein TnpB [Gammaproteobacteria bacterium]
MNSLFPFPIPNVKHVYLYSKPISMKLGENKLIDLCINEMELNPDKGLMFLFFNKAHDKIKLFYLDESGSQEIVKILPRGGFLLPVATDNQKYLKIDINKLPSLFRM